MQGVQQYQCLIKLGGFGHNAWRMGSGLKHTLGKVPICPLCSVIMIYLTSLNFTASVNQDRETSHNIYSLYSHILNVLENQAFKNGPMHIVARFSGHVIFLLKFLLQRSYWF